MIALQKARLKLKLGEGGASSSALTDAVSILLNPVE